ncbi:CDP-glycerol:poly(glycerophosphate) glycerophosphotransferase (plasmid) [Solidesulfovibrio carbinoliphilus subsp. oakridgensis]|uniref:CDP-glycerol:poly(Glycerophosphate) glycerophosphotransferase n=1 Tax=Solidesulfovibrio carbinoliphilus subsp. oakridgensis TaxID=694327 RepID=G7QE61_9BACT|nr:CDP-glycerol glycerophosphotransferase family protein [Solidesulfovibrio carbinoliphilus]EHJ45955.1 CDP-glycerol:poly(glycerophosphate) glycerophosphotransferase [Solidesulfovibrio carbinoliphilus subsp. oakridgensis]
MHARTAADRLAAVLAKTPREHDRVVFVGRSSGLFIDNGKYAFLHAQRHAPHLRTAFMTFEPAPAKALRAHGLPAFCFTDAEGPAELARAGIVVSDDFWWRIKTTAPDCTKGAFMVQLWHGIPLKAIGFPEIRSSVNMNPQKAEELTRGYSGYDAVLSTSPFFCEKAFSRAFAADRFWNLGYPRNDALLRAPDRNDMLNVDGALYADLVRARKNGDRLVFYMPTFRDTGGNALSAGALDPRAMAAFAQAKGIQFVCKFHPYEDTRFVSTLPHFRFCDAHTDPYPLLQLADLLITDYSSIYFDFLLTGKPVLFFPYDLEDYVTRNRELLFDYDSITPGPKVRDTPGLQAAMLALLDGNDPFLKPRRTLARLAFAHQDAGSGQRLVDALTAVSRELGRAAPSTNS